MKIHLVCVSEGPYRALLERHAQSQPQRHTLTENADEADFIVMAGIWGPHGEGICDHPLTLRYPEKTFVYWDADGFTPLLPGVYANAEKRRFLHRTESQMFVNILNRFIGPRDIPKKYLFSFAGGSTSVLRKRLYKIPFNRPDILIENTSSYHHWDWQQEGHDEWQLRYAETLAQSHFGLCPRGASAGGLRLYEVMQTAVCPVILSDKLDLPYGPDWDRFAIRVPERNLGKLPEILEGYLSESAERGRLAREAYEQWFAPEVVFNRIVEVYERELAHRKIPERRLQLFWPILLWRDRTKRWVQAAAKASVLWVFRKMGKRFVYDLNRP